MKGSRSGFAQKRFERVLTPSMWSCGHAARFYSFRIPHVDYGNLALACCSQFWGSFRVNPEVVVSGHLSSDVLHVEVQEAD